MVKHKITTRHILVAEDDSSISEILCYLLREVGYEATIPADFSHLKSLLKTGKFDLILLDLKLWDKDGKELCKDIKTDSKTRHIPVILLTASSEARFSVDELGAEDIIEKPFEINILLERIKKYIRG